MPKLLAIVAVDPSDRVRCQQPNCGHSVYRRIHVVEDAGHLLVLGSTCFAKRYGSCDALGSRGHGGGDGRKLNDAERQLLVENTAALLAQFESQRQAEQAKRLAKREALRAQAEAPRAVLIPASIAPARQEVKASAWSWIKPMTSMAYFHLRDGTGWLRVQHVDGQHMLMPWPKFDGWDEVFPASVGTAIPDLGGYRVRDLVSTVGYLREREEWEKVSGVWREIVGEIARRKGA